ncbi:FecR family protein [Verrucomicrobia bacterium]|nr:FecR family protein [Verrucomicrobiota bacterium]
MELIGRYLNGETTQEEVVRLENLMLDDPQLRADFLTCARVDAALPEAVGEKMGVIELAPAVDAKTGWFPTAAAAALVILAGCLWWKATQHKPVELQIVARFVKVLESRWMVPDTRVASGDVIRTGQRIELSSGSAEVQFNSGARMTLSGPSILEPLSENSVLLILGEVSVMAETPESKGFTVVTPNSKFIDISTAFTATVSPDGLSRLEVSEGEVDVVLDGVENARRLKAGETLYVEPGKRKIVTLIEAGDGTGSFRFPTIASPSQEDYADQAAGHATIRVAHGELQREPSSSGPASVLIDGVGQSKQDSPRESAFFRSRPGGSVLMDLGQTISISRINSYSWHQNKRFVEHRERARQRFVLYGFAGDELPDLDLPPEKSGWTRIARVNSDNFFRINKRLDRPAQQACSISAAEGSIGQFRHLLWEVQQGTFYGEFDVYGEPSKTVK